MSDDELRDRIVNALRAQVSPLRGEGVALGVDFVLGRKVEEVVDLHAIRAVVMDALTEENLERIVSRHVAPGFARFDQHVVASVEVVGGLVPPESRDRIAAIVEKSRLPKAAWAAGMIDPALLRQFFAPVWAHVLMNFAKRLPMPGGGMAAGAAAAAGKGALGLAGRIGRASERIVDAGRSVMGGLGAEVERRFQGVAKEFSDGAAEIFREALKDRIRSEEGREAIARMSEQIQEHVMKTRLSAIHQDYGAVPVEDVLAAVPGIVGHARTRPFVAQIVEREVAAFLAVDGQRTVKELLVELGIHDAARATAIAHVEKLAQGLAETDAFAEWVGRLLDA